MSTEKSFGGRLRRAFVWSGKSSKRKPGTPEVKDHRPGAPLPTPRPTQGGTHAEATRDKSPEQCVELDQKLIQPAQQSLESHQASRSASSPANTTHSHPETSPVLTPPIILTPSQPSPRIEDRAKVRAGHAHDGGKLGLNGRQTGPLPDHGWEDNKTPDGPLVLHANERRLAQDGGQERRMEQMQSWPDFQDASKIESEKLRPGAMGQAFDFGYSRVNTQGGHVASYNTIHVYQGAVHHHLQDLHNRVEAVLRPYVALDSQLGGQFIKENCLPGTRLGVFKKIRTWMKRKDGSNPPGSHQQCLCVVGVPGSGKSTIACSVAGDLIGLRQDNPTLVVAHYFIRRGVASTTNASCIFPTLATRLSQLVPSIAELLHNNLGDLSSAASQTLAQSAQALLLDPIRRQKIPFLIIIDALDEVSEPRKFAQALSHIVQNMPPNLRLFVTTRNEHNILINLGYTLVDQIALEISTKDSADDVEQYLKITLRSEIEGLFGSEAEWKSWPTDSQIAALSEKASGLFVWAATAVRLVVTLLETHGPARRDRFLEQVQSDGMESLQTLYTLVLNQAFGQGHPERLKKVKIFLGFLVAAAKPLGITTIEALLGLHGDEDFDARWFFQMARSVLVQGAFKVEDNTAPQMHKSFVDYLTSSAAGRYRVDWQNSHTITLLRCFRVMQNHLRFNICDLKSSFLPNSEVEDPPITDRVQGLPLELLYGSELWGHHLQGASLNESGVQEALDHLLRKQFLFWLEVVVAGGFIQSAGRALYWLAFRIGSSVQSSTFQALANDAYRFYSEFRPCIEHSLPHLYLSALALAPAQSLLSIIHRNATTTRILPPAQGRLRNWDPCQAVLTGHAARVYCVAVSPDGSYIASGSSDYTIRVWDIHSGTSVLGPLNGHTDSIHSLCFSPDGHRIISGSHDHTIRVWDAHTGEHALGPLIGHTDRVYPVAISPNGRLIISGSNDGTVCIWDAQSGNGNRILKPPEAHTSAVLSVASSPDALQIVSGSRDNTIRVWDVQTGQLVLSMAGHDDDIRSVAFSPSGLQIVSGSGDHTVRIWDAQTGSPVLPPLKGHTFRVSSVAFSPDGDYVASGSGDGTIRVWHAKSGECVFRTVGDASNAMYAATFSPDGHHIISCSDSAIHVWDLTTTVGDDTPGAAPPKDGKSSSAREEGNGHDAGDVLGPLDSHTGAVLSVGFSQDGQQLISSASDRTVRIWDTQTGKPALSGILDNSSTSNSSTALSSDNRLVVASSSSTTVRVWDAQSGELLMSQPLSVYVWTVALSPDARLVASGDNDYTLQVWDVQTGTRVCGPLRGHEGAVRSVTFSPDSQHIASGSDDHTVRVWDAQIGNAVFPPLEGHKKAIFTVACSPDGRYIASGSDDDTIRLWNAQDGSPIMVLHGHTSFVRSVAFSLDSLRIVSGSINSTIRVWDTQNGVCIRGPLTGHTSYVNSVAFSPDGLHVASGSSDRTIRVWALDPPETGHQPTKATATSPWTPLYNEQVKFRDDGWVVGTNGELLFWVPHRNRGSVYGPLNTLVIGTHAVRLDLSNLVDGTKWQSSF